MIEHTRNNPHRWQKKAAEFQTKRGHPQRVFCSSLADVFDNEVPDDWRAEAFTTMEATPDLRWQLCTKRISNVAKMVSERWAPTMEHGTRWPSNVGLLITAVTPRELLRDVSRLVELKRRFGLPWVGLSIEPMIEDVTDALAQLSRDGVLQQVDWAIFGGESGRDARPLDVLWITRGVTHCAMAGVTVFVKQLGADAWYQDRRLELKEPSGSDPREWPHAPGLQCRNFPAALC